MCGIVGILDYRDNVKESSRNYLLAMNELLQHRGPDDEGYYMDRHIGLGHKRLAIIDLVAGTQPMKNDDGSLVLVYNGEIYNFTDLRKELESAGCRFHTRSDTEVLLKSYETWGADCLQHFNGDFAFAVWDGRKEELFLARDRVGVKPLFYAHINGTFLFSSEMKSILKHPKVSRTIDEVSLVEILGYFQPVPPRTLIKAIEYLEPGHFMVVNRDGVKKKKYWDLEYKEITDDFNQAKEKVSWLIADATKIRMVSDVPICGLLSGGLDSTILCSLMSAASDEQIQTFSLNFEGNRDVKQDLITHVSGDDLSFAQEVAKEIGSLHHEIIIASEEYFDLLPIVAEARDLPVVMGNEIGIHGLCREVRKNATVAISGEGADEVCLGYYFLVNKVQLESEINPFFLVPADKFAYVLSPRFKFKHKPFKIVQERFADYLENIPVIWGSEKERTLSIFHYLQIKYMLPYLLDRADRISMASSVELRVPFCDHRFVEYYFNLPASLKLKEGVEKYLLRESFRGKISDSVVDRKKSVFPYPIGPTQLGKLYDRALELTSFKNRKHSKVRKLFVSPLLRLTFYLATKGMIPTIGTQMYANFAVTMDHLAKKQELAFTA